MCTGRSPHDDENDMGRRKVNDEYGDNNNDDNDGGGGGDDDD